MFHTLFYKPMYNTLVYILSLLPDGNVFYGIIILTVVVKIILLPLSKKMFLSQIAQKKIQPLMKKLQEEYKDNKQILGLKMMELYKEHKLNPLSSIFLMCIQIPIVFALYFVFAKGGLPTLNMDDLYSFTPHIVNIKPIIFGINFTLPSVFIGLVAAIFQYIQIRFSLTNIQHGKGADKPLTEMSTEEMMQKQMGFMMKYFIPIMIFLVSFKVSAAVAMYWIISSVFMISQELYFRKKFKDQL